MPTIEQQNVLRSARTLDRYGPDFRYGHFVVIKRLRTLAGLAAGLGAAAALSQLRPARTLLLRFRKPGEGPSAEQRASGWFTQQIVAEGAGSRIVVEVSGGDPWYGEAAKILAESALCLVYDHLPPASGQLTAAAAMGEPLIGRLSRAGITFRVTERTGAQLRPCT
jgi:short subunit dehydrogenase-like uncharacterized protein